MTSLFSSFEGSCRLLMCLGQRIYIFYLYSVNLGNFKLPGKVFKMGVSFIPGPSPTENKAACDLCKTNTNYNPIFVVLVQFVTNSWLREWHCPAICKQPLLGGQVPRVKCFPYTLG